MTIDRKRFEQLMMAAVDEELNDAGRRELEDALQSNPEWADEYDAYQHLKKRVQRVRFEAPPRELWDTYWLRVYNRLERGIGWILLSIGAVILLAYFGVEMIEAILNDPDLALIAKIGLFIILAGFAVLSASVVREKFSSRKHDPYKEVVR